VIFGTSSQRGRQIGGGAEMMSTYGEDGAAPNPFMDNGNLGSYDISGPTDALNKVFQLAFIRCLDDVSDHEPRRASRTARMTSSRRKRSRSSPAMSMRRSAIEGSPPSVNWRLCNVW